MDGSPPDSSVRGNFQARILEWVAISLSRGSSRPRDQTRVFCIARQMLYHLSHREAISGSRRITEFQSSCQDGMVSHLKPCCPFLNSLTWLLSGFSFLTAIALHSLPHGSCHKAACSAAASSPQV